MGYEGVSDLLGIIPFQILKGSKEVIMNVEDVKKVGVLGAGTMGSGIAQVVASNGRGVVLLDVSDSALDRGMKSIRDSLARFVKKGEIKERKNGIYLYNY